ncbi:MAG: glycine dehydrogenase (aminomethyl-transferring), partial [Gammaproteobacteria bacterium]
MTGTTRRAGDALAPTLAELESGNDFLRRHIGPAPADIDAMLASLGYTDLDALIQAVVPADIRADELPQLEPPITEQAALGALRHLSERNRVFTSMIGMGYYGTVTPSVIRRNVLENPAWYTAYTPYQAEISQGRLEALLGFQQMVMDLTGMTLANASMLDEATAAAEAMAMAHRVARAKSDRFAVSARCHPQTIAVVRTRARPLGIEIVEVDPGTDIAAIDCFGALVQYPDTLGHLGDLSTLADGLHARGAILA